MLRSAGISSVCACQYRMGSGTANREDQPVGFARTEDASARIDDGEERREYSRSPPMIAVNTRPVMLVLTMLALAPASAFGDDMPEPEGFRIENYRASEAF